MVELVATRLCANSGSAALVSNASLELRAGQLTVILGANGAGKTSLMRMLAGVMMPTSGTVSVKGLDLKAMSVTQRAKYISYLPQSVELAWGISVYDCVSLGRFAWGGAPGRLSAGDERPDDGRLATTVPIRTVQPSGAVTRVPSHACALWRIGDDPKISTLGSQW